MKAESRFVGLRAEAFVEGEIEGKTKNAARAKWGTKGGKLRADP